MADEWVESMAVLLDMLLVAQMAVMRVVKMDERMVE